jgi:hypothetical protein
MSAGIGAAGSTSSATEALGGGAVGSGTVTKINK